MLFRSADYPVLPRPVPRFRFGPGFLPARPDSSPRRPAFSILGENTAQTAKTSSFWPFSLYFLTFPITCHPGTATRHPSPVTRALSPVTRALPPIPHPQQPSLENKQPAARALQVETFYIFQNFIISFLRWSSPMTFGMYYTTINIRSQTIPHTFNNLYIHVYTMYILDHGHKSTMAER